MDLLDTRRPRTLLIAFCLLLWLPGLFTLPPTDRDESRFAQATKQMIETGDYVRIMNGTEPRNRKPIGIYWLQVPFALVARVAGLATDNPIWPFRLPSMLGGLLAVLAVERLGRVLVDKRAALLAALMLSASIVVIAEVHLAKTDAALLGATTLCMVLLARAYIVPANLGAWPAAAFWAALAATVLLKGPVAPAIIFLAVASLVLCDGRAGWLRRLRPIWGLPLFVLLVLPWFAAIGLATHGAFFHDAVGGDLGRKLTSGDDAHGAPPGLHLALLPLLAFPSSAAALLGLAAAWPRRNEAATRFLLAWLLPAWAMFEVVPTKLPHYTLPLYPAIFMLAAQAATAGWQARARARYAALAANGVVGGLLAVGAALPWLLGVTPAIAIPAIVAAVIVTSLAFRLRRPITALAAMPLFTLALMGWELPALQPLWIAPRVEQAVIAAGLQGSPLGAVGFHEPSLLLLAGTSTSMLADGAVGAKALDEGEVRAVLVSADNTGRFENEALARKMTVHVIARVDGFNYSRGRFVALALYVRERAIEP